MVTLTGVGGVGKTRLALQVAAEVLPRFRDGAWLVNWPRSVTRSGWSVRWPRCSRCRPGRPERREALVEFLRTKQMLVVLDNCEHVLDAAADLVAVLERRAPGWWCWRPAARGSRSTVNIWSRCRRSRPRRSTPIWRRSLCRAVRLFVERARGRGRFRAHRGERDGGGRGGRRLDGVPLAIELAAARVNAMTPGGAGPASGSPLRGARRRSAWGGETPADAAGHDRLVLRPARRAPAAAAGPAGGVRGRAAPWRPSRRSAAARGSIPARCWSCWRSGGAFVGDGRGPGRIPATGCWRRSASTARNASTNTARPTGCATGTPGTTRTSSGRSGNMTAAGRGVLGCPAQRRAGQPARGVVVGRRHRQRRRRVRDPGRLRSLRGLEQLSVAASGRGGPRAARRD